MAELLAPDSYGKFLADLKGRIRTAQVRASLAVNRELVLLYWQILDRQQRENWGAKVIVRLVDLKRAFPEMKGLSPRNLKYMRAFAEAWPDNAIMQGVLAQITWYHNLAILENSPRLLRHPDDQPSIGLILCRDNDRFVAEYALRGINKPIGISEYRLAESLPEKLKGNLPTIEELESELESARELEPNAEWKNRKR